MLSFSRTVFRTINKAVLPTVLNAKSVQPSALTFLNALYFSSQAAVQQNPLQSTSKILEKTKENIVKNAEKGINLLLNNKPEEALKKFKLALKHLSENMGEQNEDGVTLHSNIAEAYLVQQKSKKALESIKTACELNIQLKGKEDASMIKLKQIHCQVLFEVGDYEALFPEIEAGLALVEKHQPNDLATKASHYALAGQAYHVAGRHKQASEYLNKALELQLKAENKDNMVLALLYESIGRIKHDTGLLEESYQDLMKALDLWKGTGKEEVHPDAGHLYRTLGSSCQSQGRMQEAELYYQKALRIMEPVLGAHDMKVIQTYNDLGTFYCDQGRPTEALNIHMKVLETLKKTLGDKHPQLSNSYNNVASTLLDLGQFEEAKKYLIKDEKLIKDVHGESHPHLSTTYSNLASVFRETGDLAKALEYDQKAMNIHMLHYGENHPEVSRIHGNIGFTLACQGDNEGAIKHYEKALEVIRKYSKGPHPLEGEFCSRIAITYENMNQFEKALEYFMISLKNYEANGAIDSIATSLNKIGMLKARLKKYSEAIELFQKGYNLVVQLYGANEYRAGAILQNLGFVCKEQEKYENALEYLNSALENKLNLFGKQHEEVSGVYMEIADTYERQGMMEKAQEYFRKSQGQ
jgi:tetratricopeptide (TPR) repeat protein